MRKFFRSWFIVVLAAVLWISTQGHSWANSPIGVLILAPDTSNAHIIKKMVKKAHIPYPVLTYFGPGQNPSEVWALESDVQELENKDVQQIIVIPLSLSVYSDVYQQWKYLMGNGIRPGFIRNNLFPIEHRVPIRFTETISTQHVVADILLDRAREISKNPSQEAVLVIVRGTVHEEDTKAWIASLQGLMNDIQQKGHFQSVNTYALQDPTSENPTNTETSLRQHVEALNSKGIRVLVLALALFPDGLDNRIPFELKGLNFSLNAKPLILDSRLAEWMRAVAVQ